MRKVARKARHYEARQLGANDRCYSVWQGMNRRCKKPNAANYNHYGGRGIKVCDRWAMDNLRGFLNFFVDMGNPPDAMSLDRINVDGNYTPKNCRWANKSEQMLGRRKFGALTHFDVNELGRHVSTLGERDLVKIFTQIIRKRK
jgi:hypothetical protein